MNDLSQKIKSVDLRSLAQSEGIELHQRGSRFVALCPLHDETAPSFYIYPSNRWKCYGCGQFGDPVDFIQQLHGCDFQEALRRLGIQGQRLTRREKNQIQQRKQLKAQQVQRERDLIHTLAILIRAARKCGRCVDLLPAWEWYHDILSTGSREEKDEVIEGLKDWPTISRNYLFQPDFNYRAWLREFETGEKNAASSKKDHDRSIS